MLDTVRQYLDSSTSFLHASFDELGTTLVDNKAQKIVSSPATLVAEHEASSSLASRLSSSNTASLDASFDELDVTLVDTKAKNIVSSPAIFVAEHEASSLLGGSITASLAALDSISSVLSCSVSLELHGVHLCSHTSDSLERPSCLSLSFASSSHLEALDEVLGDTTARQLSMHFAPGPALSDEASPLCTRILPTI